jgi:hypothetical protein
MFNKGSALFVSGMLLTAGIATSIATGAYAAESMAKKELMAAIDQCEMEQKTDARESCMDDAWEKFKAAKAAEMKGKGKSN